MKISGFPPRFLQIGWLCLFLLIPTVSGQTLLDTSGDTGDLFDRFREDQFQDLDDQEIMKREFAQKKARYDSLLTKKTPVFFQADKQEILEEESLFILTGNVKIWKDDFKVLAEKVFIDRFAGAINAEGNVEIHFGKDVLTGESAFYNFDTGEGWIRNARGVVEPSLFVEGSLLEKLPDYPKTADGQYALHDGFITACSGARPDWRIAYEYALVRIEDYAHMNKASFWVSRIPLFFTPYFFYPTKTKRATGFLIPSFSWSSRRGFIVSEEFFWVMSESMDMTIGGTYYSRIGRMEELEWRNAFTQYSRGELNIEHIKEDRSPSEDRNPQERWKGRYEQTWIFPSDIRGTLDLDFRSDQYFDQDYGVELEQEADRFMESRVSLTKNWNLAYLILDGVYEKDFDRYRDETLQHLPRLSFNSGSQPLLGIFKGSIILKTEFIKKEGLFTSSFPTDGGTMTVQDWLERDCFRSDIYTELKLPIKEVAWFTLTPYVSLRETWWSDMKTFDPDHAGGSWATYTEELPSPENKTFAGTFISGDSIRREMYGYGFEWTGPKFYRIFPLLGYERLSKIKHILEPKINLYITPEVNQEKILQFDSEDWREPGKVITYSITNRFLLKFHPKDKKKSGKPGEGQSDSPVGSPPAADETAKAAERDRNMEDDEPSETKPESEQTSGTAIEEGEIREFGFITISQSYDLWKAENWDEREPVEPGEDERDQYPLGNIRLEATVNPFANIYFSARMEYDPFHDSFSNGYLYGHTRSKSWRFGVRWDYSKNFLYPLYDLHALALEGGGHVTDHWSFASWVKYDFHNRYFPYFNLDLTYTSQCWSLTLHTYYQKQREGMGTDISPFEDTDEIQFGLSITLKNLDSVGPRKIGKFWWGNE
ncbi:LPS-assembly protein LptD [bacterium]|nr:LPS-assembly protein LptD [candidate division CSSED10-310 bacterium]